MYFFYDPLTCYIWLMPSSFWLTTWVDGAAVYTYVIYTYIIYTCHIHIRHTSTKAWAKLRLILILLNYTTSIILPIYQHSTNTSLSNFWPGLNLFNINATPTYQISNLAVHWENDHRYVKANTHVTSFPISMARMSTEVSNCLLWSAFSWSVLYKKYFRLSASNHWGFLTLS
jgi:hypothetical protein